jgi:hypothetical protein
MRDDDDLLTRLFVIADGPAQETGVALYRAPYKDAVPVVSLALLLYLETYPHHITLDAKKKNGQSR